MTRSSRSSTARSGAVPSRAVDSTGAPSRKRRGAGGRTATPGRVDERAPRGWRTTTRRRRRCRCRRRRTGRTAAGPPSPARCAGASTTRRTARARPSSRPPRRRCRRVRLEDRRAEQHGHHRVRVLEGRVRRRTVDLRATAVRSRLRPVQQLADRRGRARRLRVRQEAVDGLAERRTPSPPSTRRPSRCGPPDRATGGRPRRRRNATATASAASTTTGTCGRTM